jgi:hypothetical protein
VWIRVQVLPGEPRASFPTGAGVLGRAGCGWWAGPETATLGLGLALAWRAAAGELCVGMSQGRPPATPETGATGRLFHPGPALRAAGTSRGPEARPEDRELTCRPLSIHQPLYMQSLLCVTQPSSRGHLARQTHGRQAAGRDPRANSEVGDPPPTAGPGSPAGLAQASQPL